MKINEIGKGIQGVSNARNAPEHADQIEKSRTFSRHLTDMGNAQYEEHITKLVGRIFEQGEIVKSKADMKELQKYRQMISELMNETVSNSYVFDKSGTFDSSGRHKIYATIKKINDKLDNMTQGLLDDQSENINLLSQVDDIKGMLVDLFL